MWVATPGPEYKLEHKQISFVPGLYRIFDEILGITHIRCYYNATH